MANYVHQNDLPDDLQLEGDIAVDSETMGLKPGRDRLCVVQLSDGNGDAHLVQFDKDSYDAPNLKALLTDPKRVKIFHYARFDMAVIKHCLGIDITPVYCTKIASRIARTYTDSHGLKDLCEELLKQKISKKQQSSNWGAKKLTNEQIKYAAGDVLYLHEIRAKLQEMLEKEGRTALVQSCIDFLPARVELDLAGWEEVDIFHH